MFSSPSLTIHCTTPGHIIGEEINGFVILKIYQPTFLNEIKLKMVGYIQTFYKTVKRSEGIEYAEVTPVVKQFYESFYFSVYDEKHKTIFSRELSPGF